MAELKLPCIGVYGPKMRELQKKLSFERTSLTFHPIVVHRYLGSRTNASPSTTDIQDPIFLETRDRAYSNNPITINASVEFLPESQFDLSRIGIINPLGNTIQFRVHILSFEADGLGRYLIAGDVVEVPFWEQDNVKSFWEITDVDRKTEFENFLVVVTATPLEDAQETEEIDGVVSDKSLLDQLDVSIEADQDAVFAEGLLDPESDLYLADDYIDDDYIDVADPVTYTDEAARTDYDQRPGESGDFLDDPTSRPF